jgi:hypothetical protein
MGFGYLRQFTIFGSLRSNVEELHFLPRMLRLVARRSTRAPYKVWQYDQPSKTIPRLLGKLARGLNGISGIRRR